MHLTAEGDVQTEVQNGWKGKDLKPTGVGTGNTGVTGKLDLYKFEGDEMVQKSRRFFGKIFKWYRSTDNLGAGELWYVVLYVLVWFERRPRPCSGS